MNILAVSSNAALLTALEGILKGLFPGAVITRAADPLMAGKYAFQNMVDIVLAQADMKRMDGIQLIRFVRQERTAARAYLMGQESVLRELPLSVQGEVTGLLTLPCTAAEVAAVLHDDVTKNKEGQTL